MASAEFAVALVLFHLALFTSFYFSARERRAVARGALAVALVFLAYVAYDIVRDPAPERLGGLAMGLAFMFALLWLGGATLFTRVAMEAGHVSPGLRWLVGRSGYWTTSGSVGTLLFGAVFPRLRGMGGAVESWAAALGLALAGIVLAAVAIALVFLRVRQDARAVRDPSAADSVRAAAAVRAAGAAWGSLALGVSAVLLLAGSGWP